MTDPAARLMETVGRSKHAPTQHQVAVVLHALADHTLLMHALHDSTQATTVGNWLHRFADHLEYTA